MPTIEDSKTVVPDHVMVGGRKHYLTDAEISFIHQLANQRIDIERLVTTVKREQSAKADANELRDLYREHLRDALKKLDTADCEECEGTGGAEKWEDHTNSRSWEPDERMVGYHDPTEEACHDCCGTGKVLV